MNEAAWIAEAQAAFDRIGDREDDADRPAISSYTIDEADFSIYQEVDPKVAAAIIYQHIALMDYARNRS